MQVLNVDIINPFLNAMSNVLVTMATLTPKAGKVALKDDEIAFGEVTGVIGMTGSNFKGSMAITFTQPVILDIASRMLGENLRKIDSTVTDLVGEITNMVTGGAKNLLAEKGYDIGMATPVVVTGPGHRILHQAHGPKIVIPFTVECGHFFVEVCFEKT